MTTSSTGDTAPSGATPPAQDSQPAADSPQPKESAASSADSGSQRLQMTGISKRFGAVRAIRHADMTVDVGCPACHHEWETWIDVPGFLWTEVAASARRVAGEVAGLAVAYGWRESDVLALSPWRRQLYLDLAAE